jgi:hypothetical protein
MSRLGSNYGEYARIPLCRGCGNPFVPPGVDGCCSVRCTQYLASRQPVLGDPLFGPQQSMLCRGGCGLRFDSRGLVLCVECWDRSRSNDRDLATFQDRKVDGLPTERVGKEAATPAVPRPVRHDEPINDRNPRTRCHW